MSATRSELVVPASNPRMIAKGLASDADIALLDLEDAVAPSEKPQARQHVIAALRDQDWHGKPRAIRINALDTPYCYRDLVDVVEAAGDRLDLIVMPKANHAADVYVVATLLQQIEQHIGLDRKIKLEVQIETASALIHSEAIAAASDRIHAINFGPGDFAASAGMPVAQIGVPDQWDAAYGGHRWHYAMSRIVIAARAAGVRATDGPYADFRDEAGFLSSCRTALALGFDGKWCIHPSQIAIANEVFTPSDAEIAWARKVVSAYADATATGLGAISIDGKMIDAASIRMAERILGSSATRPN